MDYSVSGINGYMADVAEASKGCGEDCGWMRESQLGCCEIWGDVVAS